MTNRFPQRCPAATLDNHPPPGRDIFRRQDQVAANPSAVSRLWYRALDAVLTSPLRRDGTAFAELRRLCRLRTSNYERVRAALRLANHLAPGAAARASAWLCRRVHLPLRDVRVSLLAYGSASTVFRVRGAAGEFVLKIYRDSLGRARIDQWEMASAYRDLYEFARSWFNAAWPLVPHSTYFLLHAPLLTESAVAELQDFVPGEKRDLIGDFSDDAVRDLLRANPGLLTQFIDFVRRLARLRELSGLTIDLVGRENVLVAVRNGGRWRLHLIDVALVDLSGAEEERSATVRRQQAQLDRLERLLALVVDTATEETPAGRPACG